MKAVASVSLDVSAATGGTIDGRTGRISGIWVVPRRCMTAELKVDK